MIIGIILQAHLNVMKRESQLLRILYDVIVCIKINFTIVTY